MTDGQTAGRTDGSSKAISRSALYALVMGDTNDFAPRYARREKNTAVLGSIVVVSTGLRK